MVIRKEVLREQSRIDEAIAKAEGGTCGEIIVAIARQAGHYGFEKGLIAFAFALGTVALAWSLMQKVALESWSEKPQIYLTLGPILLILVAGFVLGLIVVRLIPALPLLLTSKRRRIRAAEEAAALAFHDLHVANTRAHTGVLLLISECERAVVVMSDGPIAKHITDGEWKGVRDTVLAAIKGRKPVDGIVSAIEQAGALLCRHFPPEQHDRDELPNAVRFLN